MTLCYATLHLEVTDVCALCSLAEVNNTEKATEDLTVENNEIEQHLLVCQVGSSFVLTLLMIPEQCYTNVQYVVREYTLLVECSFCLQLISLLKMTQVSGQICILCQWQQVNESVNSKVTDLLSRIYFTDLLTVTSSTGVDLS